MTISSPEIGSKSAVVLRTNEPRVAALTQVGIKSMDGRVDIDSTDTIKSVLALEKPADARKGWLLHPVRIGGKPLNDALACPPIRTRALG